MATCLVTKLKDGVNNPNLEKLGILDVVLDEGGLLSFTQNTEVTLLNGVYKDTGLNKKIITAGELRYYTTNNCTLNQGETKYKLEFGKYHFSAVQNPYSTEAIDLEKLFKWSDSNSIDLRITNGSTLKNLNSMTSRLGGEIRLTGSNVYFVDAWDVTQLGVSENLTRVLIDRAPGGYMQGSFDNLGLSNISQVTFASGNWESCSFVIENFVRKNISKGRTTKSVSIRNLGCPNTTFKGEIVTTNYDKDFTLSWSPSANAGYTDVTLTDGGSITITDTISNS